MMMTLTRAIEHNDIQRSLANFRACGGRLAKKSLFKFVKNDFNDELEKSANDYTVFNKFDVLDPNNHQRLAVLFCSFSHDSQNAPAFCVNPW